MTLRDLGRAAAARLPGLEPLARRVYRLLPPALHDTPTARLRRFFVGARSVAFVQVGAFDGCAGDPIRPLVVARPGWRGVLVEPQAEAFARLRQNYRAQAGRLAFVEAAVAAEAGRRTLYAVPWPEIARLGLPDWAAEIASFDRAHVERYLGAGAAGCRIAQTAVRTVRFADLAARLPDGRVDLIVVDAEGAERAVLEGVDFDAHGVGCVVYEHAHLAAADAAFLADLLARHGFAAKAFGRDTVAWRGRAAG